MFKSTQQLPIRLGSFLVAGVFAGLSALAMPPGFADTVGQVPLYLVQSVAPILMLDMSRDHQLYFKAYDDYSDITGDGTPDTTYTHSFNYYGYFDHHMCYSYSTANTRFEPFKKADSNKYCDGSHWSGNFLNWASMARIDEIRKILYGGYRSTDTNSDTTLERTYLPNDAHSFAKYYSGADINQLTPVNTALTTSPSYAAASLLVRTWPSDTSRSIPSSSSLPASKQFTIALNINPPPNVNDPVTVVSNANSSNTMSGNVTTYDPATGSLTVNVTAKTGSGSSITPWTITITTTISVPTAMVSSGALSFNIGSVTGASAPRVGDQVKIANNSSPPGSLAHYMLGVVTGYSGGTLNIYATSSNSSDSGVTSWQINDPSRVGITLCNTTVNNSGAYSENVTDPPLIRVAQGNYALWSANERWQCRWFEEKGNTGQIAFPPGGGSNPSNGNDISRTGMGANNTNPVQADVGLVVSSAGPDYVARVQVCKTGTIGDYEKCKGYEKTGSAQKPIGVLQDSGDDGSMWVGLLTGSYGKNKSGGVLRKKAVPFNNITDLKAGNTSTSEVNVTNATATGDGTFTGTSGIVTAINKLRIYGYSHNDGTYFYNSVSASDQCIWGQNSFTNGNCSNWGNPQAEGFLESLRYLAGKTANSAFTTDDSTRITGLTTATWADPLSNNNWCAGLSVLNFNASVTSYDGDDLSTVTDINTTSSASSLTDTVGTGELINGNSYFVGENGTDNNQLCTAKTVSSLGSVKGACPEAPRLSGTYNIAGLAYQAHTHSIRSDLTNSQNQPTKQLVTTYGVALTPAIPKVTIPVPGSTTQTVTILPACRDYTGTPEDASHLIGNCTVVDFKIVQPYTVTGGVGTGSFYVNWEDSEQGGDFDQDMSGVLSYTITSSQITVTTQTYIKSTPYLMGFGYVISGTNNKDGFHAHSGINGFFYPGASPGVDPTGVAACSTTTPCQVTDAATSVTYTLGASSTKLLQPALWYAAKWGGFNDVNKNGVPDSKEWDSITAGQPDNYFSVTDPGQLETSLEKVFQSVIAAISSSSSVVANSVALQTNSRLYQARFNSGDWSGQLWSYVLNSDGSVGNVEWDAGCVLSGTSPCQIKDSTHGTTYNVNVNSQPARQIITYKPFGTSETPQGPVGVPFTWAGLGTSSGSSSVTAQQALLNKNPDTGSTDTNGQDRLNYLRGDRSKEQQKTGGIFRDRSNILGDIVDSSPAYVGPPGFSYPNAWADGGPETGYTTFRTTYANRTPIVYSGANDGMLHGFDASVAVPPATGPTSTSGTEIMAYVPNAVFASLNKLTSPNYNHQYYVDGPPTAGDAFFGSSWHTVLVGGLRGGGPAVYALDITDPSQLTESRAANIVLWEFSNVRTSGDSSDTTSWDANLGYAFSQPAIVRMANKKWAAVFGNGYHSKDLAGDGAAYLYIVDLQTGKLIKKLGPLGTAPTNGLSTPAPVDVNGDNIVDFIYAGDLQGNLWKFDVRDPSPGNWVIAFSGSPLYTAKDASNNLQPITTRPQVGANPTGTGFLIYFGTGKYYESGDNNVTGATTQTFYAVWDKNDSTHGFARSDLLQQTVLATSTAPDGSNVRVTSANPITWRTTGTPTGKMGWFIDLPTTGERQVSDALLRGGSAIFTTLIPSQHPCDYGGSGWLMDLAAASGSPLPSSPFDLSATHNGVFDQNDFVHYTDANGKDQAVPASGISSTVGIIWTPLIVSQTTGIPEFKYMSGSSASIQNVTENPGSAGRQTWRQIQ